MNRLSSRPFFFILDYAKRYKIPLFLFFIFAITKNFTVSYIIPYSIKLLTDKITTFEGQNLLLSSIPLIILCFFTYLIWSISNIFMPILDSYCIAKMERDMREDLFLYTSEQSISYFNNNFAGNLLTKINNIVYKTSNVIIGTIRILISNIFSLTFFIIFFAKASSLLTIIFLVWITSAFIFLLPLMQNIKKASKDLSTAKSKFTGVLLDILSNILVTKSYSRENFEEEKIEKESNNILYYFKKNAFVKMFSRSTSSTISLIFLTAILFLSIYLKLNNQITIGDFVFIVTVSIKSFFYISDFVNALLLIMDDVGSIADGLEKITVPHKIKDNENAKQINIKDGEIKINNLTFNYNE